jgi:hypothetical protein
MERVTVLLVAAAIGAAACGGAEKREAPRAAAAGTEETASATGATGCALVTKDEVADALGHPVGDGEEQGLAGCGWKAQSGAQIRLHVYAGGMLSPGTCASQKSLVSGRQEEISGLGDSALWGSSGDLVVCARRAVLKVDVDDTPSSPAEDRETATKVARAALGRL